MKLSQGGGERMELLKYFCVEMGWIQGVLSFSKLFYKIMFPFIE